MSYILHVSEEQLEEQSSHTLTKKDQDPGDTLISHLCFALRVPSVGVSREHESNATAPLTLAFNKP